MIPGVKALPSLRPPLDLSSIWSDDGQVNSLQGSFANFSFRNLLESFVFTNVSEFRFTFQNTCKVDHCSFGVSTTELSTRRTPIEILFKGQAGFAGDGIDPNLTITSDWMALGEDVVVGERLVVILDIAGSGPVNPTFGVVRNYVTGIKEVYVSSGLYQDWKESYPMWNGVPGHFRKASTDSYNVASVPYSGWTDSQGTFNPGGGVSPTVIYSPRFVAQLRRVEAR